MRRTNPQRLLYATCTALTLASTALADFDPIPLTPESFTHDMIVEKTAPPPINVVVTATMDGGTNNNAWTWFEQGFLAGAPGLGLPQQGTTFTATAEPNHTFKMPADYTTNNALMVYSNATGGLPTGTLTFSVPTAYNAVSVLAAAGGVVSNLFYTIHYQGGATETGSLVIYDWFNTTPPEVATNASGRVNMDSGETGNLYTAQPRLFYRDFSPLDPGTPITGITFASTNGNRAVIFGVSGSTIGTFDPIDVTGFNRDVVVERTALVGGSLASRVEVTMDGGSVNVSGNTWYEQGFNINAPTTGLPAPGSTISDATRSFTMPPSYTAKNALYLSDFRTYTTGRLTLTTPTLLTGLSFLGSAGNGPLNIAVTIHYETSPDEVINISLLDWFNAAAPIYTASGRVQAQNMAFNDVNSTNPRLFATNITITGTSPVTSIDFTRTGGGRGPIFAVSGQATAGGSFTPLAVTGFNADIIVEANPPWPPAGIRSLATATMDGGVAITGNTWNERGYYPQFPACGLPAPGAIITSLAKSDHHYQMPANYAGNNVAFVDSVRSNVNLTLATPRAYSALSFLSATANGNVTNQVIIQFQDGTSETNTFTSRDWFNNTPYAYTARGRVNVVTRHMNNAHTDNPRLYEAEFVLQNNVSAVTNIVLKFLGAANPTTGRMAVLAVSATAGAVRPVIVQVPASFLTLSGSNIVLAATMGGGTAPISYQWYTGTNGVYVPLANGGNISGTDTPSLAFTPIELINTADYLMVATNTAGPSTSAVVRVTVRSGLPDMTLPGDPVLVYQPNGGAAPPGNENASYSIDNLTSKYLNYGDGLTPFTGPAGFSVFPPRPGSIVKTLRFYTANDMEGRDPANYMLEGSRDGGETFTPISSGPLALPGARNAGGQALNPLTQNLQEVHLNNSAGYTSYRLSFSAVKGAEPSMQIGEVELLGVTDPSAVPTIVSQPTNTTANEGASATFRVRAVGPGTLGYQWYDVTAGLPGTPIPGQTSSNLVLASVTMAMNGNLYRVVVTNEFGAVTSPGASQPAAQLTVQSGPPFILSDLPFEDVVYAGRTALLPVGIGGTGPFTMQWQKNGANLAETARIIGTQSNILSIADARLSDAGTYQLVNIQNAQGLAQSMPEALSVQVIPALTPNGAGWVLNGTPTPATVFNGILELSPGLGSTARSAWYKWPLFVGAFKASFVYQDVTIGGADGIALVLQNDPRGTSALGAPGGSLGYSGITPSVALQFNIYAPNTTGIAVNTNGAFGGYATTAPVNLASGDPIRVDVDYQGGVMAVVLSNTVTAAKFQTNLAVGDLQARLGADTAWAGFTGAEGGTSARQIVSEFQYIPVPTLAARAAGGSIVLSWPASIGGYSIQSATSLTSPVWGDAGLTVNLVGSEYQATAPASTGSVFYRLVLTP